MKEDQNPTILMAGEDIKPLEKKKKKTPKEIEEEFNMMKEKLETAANNMRTEENNMKKEAKDLHAEIYKYIKKLSIESNNFYS
jgi:hypothetical protein